MSEYPADYDADTLAGIVEDELSRRSSYGTSGRLIIDFGVSCEDIAEAVARRVFPSAVPEQKR